MRFVLKIIIVIFCFIHINFVIFAQDNLISINNSDLNLFWKPKLESAFLKTFSSSHEFSSCQAFQNLGYNLAEISEIRKITPFPASLSVEIDGLQEELIDLKTKGLSDYPQIKILKFNKLNVICDKVHYFNMVIERVVFKFPYSSIDLDYLNKGRLRFIDLDKIELNIKVSEDDLLAILKLYPKAKLLSNVKVELSPNRCISKGRVKLGIIVADFKMKGRVKHISPKIINFVVDKLYLNGMPQPRAFINTILTYINPVFDSTKVWINLNIKEMNIINNFIETNATIDKKGIYNAN